MTNILLGAEGSRLAHTPPLDGGSQLAALFLSFLPPLDDIVALKDDHTPSAFGAASFGGWKVPGALDSWCFPWPQGQSSPALHAQHSVT